MSSSLQPDQNSIAELIGEEFDTASLRVEAVLSKLPVHDLSGEANEPIKIERKNERGKTEMLWHVGPGLYGMPGPLAYRIDTAIINQRIDEQRPVIPKIIRLGSLRDILRELGLSASGTNIAAVKRALLQNATANIHAKVPYRTKYGEATFEAGLTRYAVIFNDQPLPDGSRADAVYIVLHDVFWEFLRVAPIRPLRKQYLKQLSHSAYAQRLYEILSFQFFAAYKQGKARATLKYSDYCIQAPLPRKTIKNHIYTQLYRIHQPHLKAGYIAKVDYENLPTSETPDLLIHYTPGPLARQEYELFNRRALREEGADDGFDLSATVALIGVAPFPTPLTAAEELVTEFQKARYGKAQRRITKSETRLAQRLIDQWGQEKARELVLEATRNALAVKLSPTYLTALERHLEEAADGLQQNTQQAQQLSAQEQRYRYEQAATYLYEQMSADERGPYLAEAQTRAAHLSETEQVYRDLFTDPQLKENTIYSFVINLIIDEFETGRRALPATFA